MNGWLENLGKKIFEWHFCVEWWKILDSLSFDRKFLTQLNYNPEKFLIENFWLRRWKFFDRKLWINVFNGCTIFDNQTLKMENLGRTILYIPKFYKVISSKGGKFYTFKNLTRSSARGVENFIHSKILQGHQLKGGKFYTFKNLIKSLLDSLDSKCPDRRFRIPDQGLGSDH